MYKFDLDKLIPGDIILARYDDSVSLRIREESNSQFSHAMLYVGGASILEAGNTVQSSNLQRELMKEKDSVCVLRLKDEYWDEVMIEHAIMFARDIVGTLYSISEALRYKDRPEKAQEYNRQICTRLVAQVFEKAGCKLVNNVDYCSPEEILKSDKLYILEDVVIEATEKDIEFADSENPLALQEEITRNILKSIRKIANEDIQTMSQLTNYVVSHPEKGETIAKIIAASGYLDLWKVEKEKNPQNYDSKQFYDYCQENVEVEADNVISTNKRLLDLYGYNLVGMKGLASQIGENPYFMQMIELYTTLVDLCNQRIMAASLAKEMKS